MVYVSSPQKILIGPLPFPVCTEEVQCEDALPGLIAQVVPIAIVFSE